MSGVSIILTGQEIAMGSWSQAIAEFRWHKVSKDIV